MIIRGGGGGGAEVGWGDSCHLGPLKYINKYDLVITYLVSGYSSTIFRIEFELGNLGF